MSGTQVVLVPAGTTPVGPFPVTPMHNVCVGSQLLGGSILLEAAPSQSGPWTAQGPGVASTSVFSFRPQFTNQWVRFTATTSQGVAVISDMGGANFAGQAELLICPVVLATPSSTAELPLFSFRLPPNFLQPAFMMEIQGNLTITNSASVKTLNCRINGTAGTSFFTSPSLASNANYNFIAKLAGLGDGQTWKGFGAGASGGLALGGATAYTTLVRDYINQETEIVIDMTKATGADTAQLDGLIVKLF